MTGRRGTLLLCAAAAAALGPGPALAQAGRAESAFPVETIQARATGLGGGGALAGIDFVAINPAAAARVTGAIAAYRGAWEDVRDLELLVGYSAGAGAVAFRLRARDWGEVATDLGLPDLSVSEHLFGVIAAGRLPGGVTVGGALHRLGADYLGNRASGWSTDIGAQVGLPYGLRLGAALLHNGSLDSGAGGAVPLPTRLRVGSAWEWNGDALAVTAVGDILFRTGSHAEPDLGGGVEVARVFHRIRLAARAGARSIADPTGGGPLRAWTLGGGLCVGTVRVDMAHTMGDAGIAAGTALSLALEW